MPTWHLMVGNTCYVMIPHISSLPLFPMLVCTKGVNKGVREVIMGFYGSVLENTNLSTL